MKRFLHFLLIAGVGLFLAHVFLPLGYSNPWVQVALVAGPVALAFVVSGFTSKSQ